MLSLRLRRPDRPGGPGVALARDARALLAALDGKQLSSLLAQAGALLASVTGQDLDQGADGVFRIARRVAKDRIVSTVDPGARHGHKTSARGFDGYKGHVAVDPDAELITATAVTPGNAGDAAAAADLLAVELPAKPGRARLRAGPRHKPTGRRHCSCCCCCRWRPHRARTG